MQVGETPCCAQSSWLQHRKQHVCGEGIQSSYHHKHDALIYNRHRFKKRDDKGKALHASDLKGLVPTAEEMVKFTDRTTEVFGERAGWSEPLER